ncbi:rRNA-processing protein FCF1-like [Porphyridium purpureum]|uniref:rRNA-processing protein FCF1-like n=1 Tax=Porphyridium purpureum TaxID=35688 RepID=A0A5J4YPY4_PORPP|nr:rRNA-processing protein FCF1-like [Porphyridium purpureum]|eukprot:POR8452..scf296_7
MGRGKARGKSFATMKKVVSSSDTRMSRLAESKEKHAPVAGRASDVELAKQGNNVGVPAHMFFLHNTALGPPYHVLLDTNFINFSVSNKLDIAEAMLDCLYAPTVPCITDCVLAELQKLGPKYRIALRIARDRSFLRLPCTHKGTYADDCLVERVQQHRVYIVATNDKDLKRRLRKIPGVPIMYVHAHKYTIERLPDGFMAPR